MRLMNRRKKCAGRPRTSSTTITDHADPMFLSLPKKLIYIPLPTINLPITNTHQREGYPINYLGKSRPLFFRPYNVFPARRPRRLIQFFLIPLPFLSRPQTLSLKKLHRDIILRVFPIYSEKLFTLQFIIKSGIPCPRNLSAKWYIFPSFAQMRHSIKYRVSINQKKILFF